MSTGIESKHPDYVEVSEDYRVVRDTFAGERTIKAARTLYLPPTAGMVADGGLGPNLKAPGRLAYDAYLCRARFPDLVREAVALMVGILHREAADIRLPRALEPMREFATRRGEPLEALLRRINEQQLLYGRFGILADVSPKRDVPHLVTYTAETITNWDDAPRTPFGVNELNLVVLNETVHVRGASGADPYAWREQRCFRALVLDVLRDAEGNPVGTEPVYQTFEQRDDMEFPPVIPQYRGRSLDHIPFVIIGANDLCTTPDEIPLLGLANLALTIYRGEADYRQSLFMQGQDTLVILGEEIDSAGEAKPEKETRVGAGAVIRVPQGGDAKFIGVKSEGLPEQRMALDHDRAEARELGSRLLEPRGSQAESGEALRIRVAARTATLYQIALTGAAGLEKILKTCAEWVGADPKEVVVSPNTDFAEAASPPSELLSLMQAKRDGLPLSLRSIHRWARENDFTRMSFEEEQAEIAGEEPLPELEAPAPTPL